MKQKYLTFWLVLLFITCFAQTVGAQRFPTRDLARYDNGGTLDFTWELAPRHEEMKGKLREFLWEHWSQKRLGFVVGTFYSYHGDYMTHTFLVEPGQDGLWRVVSEYEGECCVLSAMQKKRKKLERKKGIEFYDVVERVEESRNGKVAWQVVSEQDSRAADKYRLRLRQSRVGKTSDSPFIL